MLNSDASWGFSNITLRLKRGLTGLDSTCCSHKEPKFNSQYPQQLTIIYNFIFRGFDSIFWTLWVEGIHVENIHTCEKTLIQEKQIESIVKNMLWT